MTLCGLCPLTTSDRWTRHEVARDTIAGRLEKGRGIEDEEPTVTTEWLIYQGAGEPNDGIDRLPPPPPWRSFNGVPAQAEGDVPALEAASVRRLGSGRSGVPVEQDEELELINAALYLRRPLLVTGAPGSGKSTLAHSIAYELRLGRVLQWPVLSRSTLRDGLYQYDAIGRLQDAQLRQPEGGEDLPGRRLAGARGAYAEIGRYIRLGPLGTALLPTAKPRVLLVDELDKSDIDLPNDLLNVLEEGEFEIPELSRIAEEDGRDTVTVRTDDGRSVQVRQGKVRCAAFPVVVMTSNGERDFPLPLLRRCIHLELRSPDRARLAAMVEAHFGSGAEAHHETLIDQFLSSAPGELKAADQLLNAIYLARHSAGDTEAGPESRQQLADRLMRPLGAQGSGLGGSGLR